MDRKVKMGKKLDEPIKFGFVDTSDGVNGEAKEVNHVGNTGFPKDIVDDWPAPKQIHTFYFVKYRSYDDPKLQKRLKQADDDVQRKSKERSRIIEELKAKRSERLDVISQLKPLTEDDKVFLAILDDKKKEMKPLQEALGKLRDANNAGLCSSKEELDDLIRSLNYRIQHESNTLVEEKQLLKQIKQLEGTRDKVNANSAALKEGIRDKVKLKYADLDEVRKEQQVVRNKIKLLEEKLKAIDNGISSLQEELTSVTEKREKAYQTLLQLRKARDEANVSYFQNRSLLNSARELAAKKDIVALEGLSHSEVEKFMSQWSSSKTFRDDYEERILVSLDSRQLTRDGRMRNPDEKPILSSASAATESEAILPITTVKRAKEVLKPSSGSNIVSNHKDQEEDITKSTKLELRGKDRDTADTRSMAGIDKLQKETTEFDEIDAAKLKEIKRQEEIAKAKLALERKKKLAEKAGAKAAIRAQKEAEKKLQEKEKRARKKAGASVPTPADDSEVDSEVPEPEEKEANLSTEALTLENNKEQKENVVRHHNRPKVKEQIPKIILKRKKSHPHWMWAASAIVLVLVLVISGFYFSFGKTQSA